MEFVQASPTKVVRISAGKIEPATDTTYPSARVSPLFFSLGGPGRVDSATARDRS